MDLRRVVSCLVGREGVRLESEIACTYVPDLLRGEEEGREEGKGTWERREGRETREREREGKGASTHGGERAGEVMA